MEKYVIELWGAVFKKVIERFIRKKTSEKIFKFLNDGQNLKTALKIILWLKPDVGINQFIEGYTTFIIQGTHFFMLTDNTIGNKIIDRL